jgi:hypothetical protein
MQHSSRLMEKDNKKARDSARKEYNETVRVRSTASCPLIAITEPDRPL